MSACFHDPIPVNLHSAPASAFLDSAKWWRRRMKRMRQADGRLQQSTVKGRNALLWSPSTPGTLLIARFVMQMPADRASHLPPFLLPLSSTESKTSLSLSLYSTRLACPRIFKRLPSLSFSNLSPSIRRKFLFPPFPRSDVRRNFRVSSGWPLATWN